METYCLWKTVLNCVVFSTGAGLMIWSFLDQILRKTTISDKDLVTNSYLQRKECHCGPTKTEGGQSWLPFPQDSKPNQKQESTKGTKSVEKWPFHDRKYVAVIFWLILDCKHNKGWCQLMHLFKYVEYYLEQSVNCCVYAICTWFYSDMDVLRWVCTTFLI